MNEPILEALNFVLETDLHVGEVRAPSAAAGGPLYSRKSSHHKNSSKILPSSVILGEACDSPCPIPGCMLISPPLALGGNKAAFLAHLLREHKLVIDDVDNIANLHKYVSYWKDKFEVAPIKDYCVGFIMEDIPAASVPLKKKGARFKEEIAGGGSQGMDKEQVDIKNAEKPVYFMLTPVLDEDKLLRDKLWKNRLETILEVNREEREQTDFSRQCFFCREVFTKNRAALFDHMKNDHSFHIGKPDNIVFVEEFCQLVCSKLESLICLNCEKVFKDKQILRDHMRKKGHKRLNADNPEYNRYYLINYLEPGKDWKAFELQNEDQEDERVEEDWIEQNEENSSIVCLFCSHQNSDFEQILSHMKSKHFFEFLKVTENLDFYQKVKIVNFIRRTIFLNRCLYCEQKFFEKTSLIEHVSEHNKNLLEHFPPQKVWNQPEYYFPTYENDQFLVFLDKDMDDAAIVNDISSHSSEIESETVIPEDLPNVLPSLKEEELQMELE